MVKKSLVRTVCSGTARPGLYKMPMCVLNSLHLQLRFLPQKFQNLLLVFLLQESELLNFKISNSVPQTSEL